MKAKRDTLRNLMDQLQVGMWINFTTTAGLPTDNSLKISNLHSSTI